MDSHRPSVPWTRDTSWETMDWVIFMALSVPLLLLAMLIPLSIHSTTRDFNSAARKMRKLERLIVEILDLKRDGELVEMEEKFLKLAVFVARSSNESLTSCGDGFGKEYAINALGLKIGVYQKHLEMELERVNEAKKALGCPTLEIQASTSHSSEETLGDNIV